MYIFIAHFFSLYVQTFYLYLIDSKSVLSKNHFITKNNLIIILWWRLKLPSFATYRREWEMFNFVKLVSMKINIIVFHTFLSHLSICFHMLLLIFFCFMLFMKILWLYYRCHIHLYLTDSISFFIFLIPCYSCVLFTFHNHVHCFHDIIFLEILWLYYGCHVHLYLTNSISSFIFFNALCIFLILLSWYFL